MRLYRLARAGGRRLHTDTKPERPVDRRLVVAALGIGQILAWGTSFYFPAVFAMVIVAETGWSFGLIVSGTSLGLLVAGLISPKVGVIIARRGGRPVLLASSLFFAAGLAGVGLAPNLPAFLASWVLIGVGMGTGTYDAVFATLGRLYGHDARGPITNLTLFGGFASTVCWPLSAFMIEHAGWRMACLIYAALHLLVVLPLQMAVLRPARDHVMPAGVEGDDANPPAPERIAKEGLIFVLVALVLSLSAGIGSIVIVNFMVFLQARGVDYAVAVSLGTLFGPAQVGARLIERLFGAHYHPIWTMIVSCVLMAISLIMLLGNVPALVLIVLLYGAGFGISWIGRGTLPLALFGPVRYPRLMGKIAFPSLIVLASSPSAGALAIERFGVDATIGLLTGLAFMNVVLIALLWVMCRAQLRTET